MSQSDHKSDKRRAAQADLGDALKQLETLLDTQTGDDEASEPELPVLDDVVDPDAVLPNDAAEEAAAELTAALSTDENARPDPRVIRQLLDQLAGRMEIELESVVGLLKYNVLQEFRQELANALQLDVQELDTPAEDDKDTPVNRDPGTH